MECGSILLFEGQRQRRFWKMRRGKGKKECKVSGNRHRFSERSWSKPEEMWIWDVAPKSCGKAVSQQGDDSCGEFRKGCREKEKSSEWTLEKIREACEKLRQKKIGRLGIVQENVEEKYGFPQEDHCASLWKERSHLVVYLPALQQFPVGVLHLVGFDQTLR